MKDWEKTLISPSTSIMNTVKIIDTSAMQIALVIDENNKLLGTVTDGDIRRGILKGVLLEQPVTEVMKTDPVVANPGQKREDILKLMKEKRINQLPVVDKKGCVIRLEILGDLIQSQFVDNLVVLMAGGLGTRLKPLTDDCPKPMVKVGDKPVLETILTTFIEQGFKNFFIAVNHMAKKIQDHFGEGSKWNVKINYLVENKKMGTAGALSLLPENLIKPILVMNGDLLTNVNYKQLIDFHHENEAAATMCVREYGFQIPYGVVKINNNLIKEIDEKPVQRFFVNAGIYVLEPKTLKLLPENKYIDMTTLFDIIVKNEMKAAVFPIREYWIDIGYHKDYEKANRDYGAVFIND